MALPFFFPSFHSLLSLPAFGVFLNCVYALSQMADDDDGSVIKIVISTDNHLGYKERDPIRSMDSFAAFEEVKI